MDILKNELLSKHTSLGIGGAAEFFCIVYNVEELKQILQQAYKENKNINIIGSGTNILVSDNGVKGYVVKLAGDFGNFMCQDDKVVGGASASLSMIISKCGFHGLSGLEYCAGIPGTLGGAVKGNAGAQNKNIGDFVEEVWAVSLDGKRDIHYTKKDIIFNYRKCELKESCVITKISLKLDKEEEKKIEERCKIIIENRLKSQPYDSHSAGCVFKNPIGYSAGELIDKSGLKCLKKGNVWISEKHANFFVCEKNASSNDFMYLVNKARTIVKEKFNVNLELEIKLWGIIDDNI
jgi:UDP-N-acetylmuramate dehydrogenase